MKDPVKNLVLALYPQGDVTQWFGENPKLYAPLDLKGHNGIDIVRPWGEHMFAVEDGTIAEVKNDADGYGKHVRLISTDIKREWTYGHCSEIVVKVGQKVSAGQHIANMGNTGFVVSNSTGNGFWKSNPYAGTHVHFGLRLIKKDTKGWTYKGSGIPKFSVLDHGNGYKGAVNPLPFIREKSLLSNRIEETARRLNSNTWLQLSVLLKKIGL